MQRNNVAIWRKRVANLLAVVVRIQNVPENDPLVPLGDGLCMSVIVHLDRVLGKGAGPPPLLRHGQHFMCPICLPVSQHIRPIHIGWLVVLEGVSHVKSMNGCLLVPWPRGGSMPWRAASTVGFGLHHHVECEGARMTRHNVMPPLCRDDEDLSRQCLGCYPRQLRIC